MTLTVHITAGLRSSVTSIVNDGIDVSSAQHVRTSSSPHTTTIAPAHGVGVAPATQTDGARVGVVRHSSDSYITIRASGTDTYTRSHVSGRSPATVF